MLGAALLGQKRPADAEPHLLAGMAGLKKAQAAIPPAGRVSLAEAAERLARLCAETGRADEETKWRKEAEAMRAALPPTAVKPAKP